MAFPLFEVQTNRFCAEASDLRWPPGHWPENFAGSEKVWVKVGPILDEAENETVAMRYRDKNSTATLTVWND